MTTLASMTRQAFLSKCGFPKQWREWKMLSASLLEDMYQSYQAEARENEEGNYKDFRLDAFFWWLERELTEEQIKKLFRLSSFESSENHLKSSINRHKNCTEPLRKELFGYTRKEIPKFSKSKLAELLHFPKEWLEWKMYPDEVFLEHRREFQPGDEAGSELNRNGVFHYWLSKNLTEDQIIKLIKLSQLDPDPSMADDVRRHIQKHKNCTPKIKKMLEQ
jgi:hypothetical protein